MLIFLLIWQTINLVMFRPQVMASLWRVVASCQFHGQNPCLALWVCLACLTLGGQSGAKQAVYLLAQFLKTFFMLFKVGYTHAQFWNKTRSFSGFSLSEIHLIFFSFPGAPFYGSVVRKSGLYPAVNPAWRHMMGGQRE